MDSDDFVMGEVQYDSPEAEFLDTKAKLVTSTLLQQQVVSVREALVKNEAVVLASFREGCKAAMGIVGDWEKAAPEQLAKAFVEIAQTNENLEIYEKEITEGSRLTGKDDKHIQVVVIKRCEENSISNRVSMVIVYPDQSREYVYRNDPWSMSSEDVEANLHQVVSIGDFRYKMEKFNIEPMTEDEVKQFEEDDLAGKYDQKSVEYLGKCAWVYRGVDIVKLPPMV